MNKHSVLTYGPRWSIAETMSYTGIVWEKGTLFISVWRKAADINSCLIDEKERINFFRDVTFLTQVTNP